MFLFRGVGSGAAPAHQAGRRAGAGGMTAPPPRAPPAAILRVPLVAAVVLTLFAWPAAKVGPRDVPVGVVGPAPQAPGLELHRYGSEAAARAAIEDREVYGALVNGRKVL